MKTVVALLIVSHDTSQNLVKILACITKAKAENASLIVFPEIFTVLAPASSIVKPADIAESLDRQIFCPCPCRCDKNTAST